MARLAGVVAAGASIAGAAAAGDAGFCRALKTAVTDAPDAFEALRGARVGYVPEDGGGDDSTRYAAISALPGARGCGVDRDRSDGEDLLSTYVCWFDAGENGGAAVRRLAGEVGDCLGRAPGDRVVVTAHGVAADMQRKHFALSVGTPAPGGPVVLEIGQR